MLIYDEENNQKRSRKFDLKNSLNLFKKKYIFSALTVLTIGGIGLIPLDIAIESESNILLKAQRLITGSLATIDKRWGILSDETFKYGNSFIEIGYRYLKSQFVSEDALSINLNMKNIGKIKSIRDKAIKEGILIRSNNDKVKGTMEYKGSEYPIRLRLKGDWTDHLLGDKWSFRVETRKNKFFKGMNEFSLQHPRTRGYISEYIFHQILKNEKLPYLRYEFIPLYLNGKYLGTYALEEHFGKPLIENSRFREGPILRLSDSDLRNEFQRITKIDKSSSQISGNFIDTSSDNADIATFNLNDLVEKQKNNILSQLSLASRIFDSFLKKELNTSQVFDIKTTAKYYAIADLFQSVASWYDERFYFDPVSSRFIPIGYDASVSIRERNRLLALDLNPLNIFDDPLFVKEYIKNLERISRKEYLDNFLNLNNDNINSSISLLNKSYPHVKFISEEIRKNQKYISTRLAPLKPLGFELLESIDNKKNIVKLKIYNKTMLPIQIGKLFFNKAEYYPVNKVVIKGRNKYERVKSKEITFMRNISENLFEPKEISENYILYKLNGSLKNLKQNIQYFPFIESTSINNNLVTRKPNLQNNPRFIINNNNKTISIKSSFSLKEEIILPKDYQLIINPGVKINFENQSYLVVQGALKINGTLEKPVQFKINNGGKGIIVINSSKRSKIENVIFNGLDSPKAKSLNITGGLSFYNSPVKMKNIKFVNVKSEDALNLIKSNFEIENISILGTFSDAIDVDFSDGYINNAIFNKVGNDAIDISGANVSISNIKILSSGDKAISIGEESKLEGKNIEISNSFIGLASKDLSKVRIKKMKINNTKICLAAYQKKSEYGPAFIKLNLFEADCKTKYLLEKGSSISSNENNFIPNTKDVYSKLYKD